MATYPEGNPGAYPLDPATPVGRFRLEYGDTDAVVYDPPVVGIRNYEELSDTEIETYLAKGGGSTNRAIGHIYLTLSGRAAKESMSVKDYDLQVDLTKRAADLRETANLYFGLADSEDLGAGEDAFLIVPTGTSQGEGIPEGTVPQYGRYYTWGRA